MLLERLTLTDFRNYRELELAPTPGLNVLVGANAQGKSNLLEGIAMLGTGKSFRTARETDVLRTGCDRAVLHGEAAIRAGRVELACAIERSSRGTRKRYTVNTRSVRYAGYLGRMQVVTFVPADLHLASSTPGARRAFLNAALSQSEPGYYHDLASYRKAIQQKNALLKGAIEPDADLLAAYDHSLVEAGARIMLARDRTVRKLAREAAQAHARFAHGERLEVCYEPNVAFDEPAVGAIAAALENRLRHCLHAERARKSAIVGPHRDDVGMRLGGLPLAAYGSQGQQRTAVLALKVAQYAVMRERTDEAPLLLLDDVLSELDDERASALVAEIGAYDQAFVTATHSPTGLREGARLARVHGGRVEALAPC